MTKHIGSTLVGYKQAGARRHQAKRVENIYEVMMNFYCSEKHEKQISSTLIGNKQKTSSKKWIRGLCNARDRTMKQRDGAAKRSDGRALINALAGHRNRC